MVARIIRAHRHVPATAYAVAAQRCAVAVRCGRATRLGGALMIRATITIFLLHRRGHARAAPQTQPNRAD